MKRALKLAALRLMQHGSTQSGAGHMKRKLKTGDYVRTADGSTGYVRYVWEAQGKADVTLDGDAERVELPIAELKRIPDPRNKLPPIEGWPEGPRPRCAYCHAYLRPFTDDERQYGDHNRPRILRRTFKGWRSYYGLFHTLRCALQFAEAAHRAGYRIQRRT